MNTGLYLFIIFISVIGTLLIFIVFPTLFATYQEQPLSEKKLKGLNQEQQVVTQEYLSTHTEPLSRSTWDELWYIHKQTRKAEKNKMRQDKFFSNPSN